MLIVMGEVCGELKKGAHPSCTSFFFLFILMTMSHPSHDYAAGMTKIVSKKNPMSPATYVAMIVFLRG